MFKVGQKVWCAIYGAGVVARIRQDVLVAEAKAKKEGNKQ